MRAADVAARTIAHVRALPVDLAELPESAVPGSLFAGGAGVAFFFYEAARLGGDEALVDRARAWAGAARKWADRASPRDWRGSAHGFIAGATGLAFVEALLADDAKSLARALGRIEDASKRTDGYAPDIRRTELFGGSAGIVVAANALAARLGTPDAHVLLDRVRARAAKKLERARAADVFGMAHGAAGEVWALATVLGANDDRVRARLAALEVERERDRSGLVFWRKVRGSDDMSMIGSFCNGMAGHTLLWADLARRSKRATRRARACAESLAATSRTTIPHLCCGLAGQAVALQRWADVSGDARYARLSRACILRASRVVASARWSRAMLGLWQGALGIALVALSRSSMPALEAP